MIHVNSVLVALRDRIAAAGLLANSAYQIEIGTPPDRFTGIQYAATLLYNGMRVAAKTIRSGDPAAFEAELSIDVMHTYYSAQESGVALLELCKAQSAILLSVNSDKSLGGSVLMSNVAESEVLSPDDPARENELWNRIRYSFTVRGSP